MKRVRGGMLVVLVAAVAGCGGCVERILKIDSRPQGARVLINDEDVGTTPVQVSFLWYGDYDIVLRKEGYRTVKTHYPIEPPWYELPGVDLFSEVFWPGMIRDVRELPAFELEPATPAPVEDVIKRAVELRSRALRGKVE